MLFSFLKLRAVVNGREIYPLPDSKPVIIPVAANNPRIVITDGFHITRPLKLVFGDQPTCYFKVGCAINDYQLAVGFLILAGLYLGGFFTGLLVMKVLSFFPLVYLLLFYYLNRKDFIRLEPLQN